MLSKIIKENKNLSVHGVEAVEGTNIPKVVHELESDINDGSSRDNLDKSATTNDSNDGLNGNMTVKSMNDVVADVNGDDTVSNETDGGSSEIADADGDHSVPIDPFVEDGLMDTILTSEMLEILSLISDSSDLQNELSDYFDQFVTVNNIYISPKADLSFLKDKANRADLLALSSQLYYHLRTWEFVNGKYDLLLRHVYGNKLFPIHNRYLRELGKVLLKSKSIEDAPFWNLALCRDYPLAKILYGHSHGLTDMVLFTDGKYGSSEFSLEVGNFVSQQNSTVRNDFRSKVDLSLNSPKNSSGDSRLEYSTTINEMLFNVASLDNPRISFKTDSIFSEKSYSSILSSCYDLTTELDIKFRQNAISERVGIVTKSKDNINYQDAFSMRIALNTFDTIRDFDKSILDPLIALRLIGDLYAPGSSDSEVVLQYVSTMFVKYVETYLYLKTGVKIESLKAKIKIVRKSDSLSKVYTDNVERGLLHPISTAQLYGYLYPDSFDWNELVFWSAISGTWFSEDLVNFLPKCDPNYKYRLNSLLYNSESLTTSYYVSDVALPWQKHPDIKLEYGDILRELFHRLMINDQIPDFIPLFTRSGWKGTNGSSPNIPLPHLHRISKFGVVNAEDEISIISKYSALRESPFTPPVYVRKLTRLFERMPPLFNNILHGKYERE